MNVVEYSRGVAQRLRFLFKGDPKVGEIFYPYWQLADHGLTRPEDYESQVNNYKSWAYICVNKRATAKAQVPLRLYVAKTTKEKFRFTKTRPLTDEKMDFLSKNAGLTEFLKKAVEVEEVISHPFLDLMKNVNPFMNRFSLIETSEIYSGLTGNTYWYISKNGTGIPAQIWVVPSHKVEIVPSKTEFISGYLYNNGFDTILLKEDEVIHFKAPSPKSVYYGMGPLIAVADAYNNAIYGLKYEAALFKNMGRPDAVFTTEKPLSDTSIELLKKRIKDEHGGYANTGKMMVLHGGVKFESLSYKPTEIITIDGRRFGRDEIANAFGVPISKLTQEANRSNADAGNYSFQSDTISPMLRRDEEKINEKFMPMYGDNRLFAAFDDNVPEDKEFKLKERNENIKSAFSTINEERAKEGLDPIEGGDVAYIPFNLVPLGTEPESEAPEREPKSKSDDKISDAEEKVRKRRWNRRAGDWEFLEKKYQADTRKVFAKQKEIIFGKLDKLEPKSVKQPSGGDYMNAVLLDEESAEQAFYSAYKNTNKAVIALAAKRVAEEINVEDILVIPRRDAISKLIKERRKYYRLITQTTNRQLEKIVLDFVPRGEPISELRKAIGNKFEEISIGRASTIARTESVVLSNGAELASMKQSGLVQKKMWLTQRDDRVRDLHIYMDGEIVMLDMPFSNGDMYPQSPNERCTTVPVLEAA